MKTKADFRVLLLYGVSIFALLLYLYGFFPLEKSFHKIDSEPHKRNSFGNKSYKNQYFQKLILVVIDALRYDFVFPRHNEYMPFTMRSIKRNESCLIQLRADAPTVTMPRLKAITSGIIPTYFDVVANLIGSNFKLDSFIQQAWNKNMKIVFYGDDTWLKLFPNAFVRSEGTKSFFASDYTEVDDNVTRHLSEEFRRNDWDFLILHYLGLDHIGHIEGPKSHLVGPKLKEMDSIILRIFQSLKQLGYEKKSLLLVTSDHGMKDSGGHGGVTLPEILLPLVSIGKPCNHLPGWPADVVAPQIDLAPTISVAFGLPLPNNNAGKLIPGLLKGMDCESVMEALELNRQQLASRASLNESATLTKAFYKCSSKSEENIAQTKEITGKYFQELDRLSKILQKVSNFRVEYLVVGIFLMWLALILLLLRSRHELAMPKKATHFFLLLGTCLIGISYGSTSFIEEEHQTWYFLWVTHCVLVMLESLNFRVRMLWEMTSPILPWISVLVCHRILRKLNQGGDKWATLPDIKGFVSSNGNHLWLIVLYAAGVLALFWCAAHDDCTRYQIVTFGSALVVNVLYRLSVSTFRLDFLSFYPVSRGDRECKIFWTITAVFFVQTAWRKRSFYLVWSLIASILLKPHNVILIAVQILTSRQFSKFYSEEDRFWNCLTHIWMGYVFYFYQGNGNSIANVDVAAGFVGLEEYLPVRSAVMIAAHTNSAHVLAFLLSPRSNFICSAFRLLLLSFYSTTLIGQLNHLFIWSVFSPKLLYETNFSMVILLLIIFNSYATSRSDLARSTDFR